MARKLRIEYQGAVYHVINRGNYRTNIFATKEVRTAFVRTLDEACCRAGWIVHAWCLMSNHYHLTLCTPSGNLVSGMQWLQSTFSARFNRYRDERGHVFQGRYKALILDPVRAAGPVCHYIHLNPIRARMMDMDALTQWPGSSLRWIMKPKERPDWFDPMPALIHAADLKDTPSGHRAYKTYLKGLSADNEAQKKLCFDQLTSGWAVGSKEFKKEVLKEATDPTKTGIEEAAEARELTWEKQLELLKTKLKPVDMETKTKSADWKVAIAAQLKRTTTVSNQWLADALDMGNAFTTSRLVKECLTGKRAVQHYKKLTGKTSKSKA